MREKSIDIRKDYRFLITFVFEYITYTRLLFLLSFPIDDTANE